MWYFSYITMATFTSGWFWISQASVQKNDREHSSCSLPVSKKTKAGFSYGCGYWWIPTSDLETSAVSRASVSGDSAIWGSILWTSTTHSELGSCEGKFPSCGWKQVATTLADVRTGSKRYHRIRPNHCHFCHHSFLLKLGILSVVTMVSTMWGTNFPIFLIYISLYFPIILRFVLFRLLAWIPEVFFHRGSSIPASGNSNSMMGYPH